MPAQISVTATSNRVSDVSACSTTLAPRRDSDSRVTRLFPLAARQRQCCRGREPTRCIWRHRRRATRCVTIARARSRTMRSIVRRWSPTTLLAPRAMPARRRSSASGSVASAACLTNRLDRLGHAHDRREVADHVGDGRRDDRLAGGHVLERLRRADVLRRVVERERHQADVEALHVARAARRTAAGRGSEMSGRRGSAAGSTLTTGPTRTTEPTPRDASARRAIRS